MFLYLITFGKGKIMVTDSQITELQNNTKLFRGKLKSLTLTTTPCFFFREPFMKDDVEQKLTIPANGRIKLSRRIAEWSYDERKEQTVIKKLVISTEDTTKIFNRISRYFSKEQEFVRVLDGGTWDLKLTNTDGESFTFQGSTCFNHRSALSRLSKLMRKITDLEYLLGFDEDTEYGLLILNKIDKDPKEVVELVKKEARKSEFHAVRYEGVFEGARVYSPILREIQITGMPEYILVKG